MKSRTSFIPAWLAVGLSVLPVAAFAVGSPATMAHADGGATSPAPPPSASTATPPTATPPTATPSTATSSTATSSTATPPTATPPTATPPTATPPTATPPTATPPTATPPTTSATSPSASTPSTASTPTSMSSAAVSGAGAIEVLAVGARANRAAIRLKSSGSIFFPLQVVKGCAVLNNYADSRSGGRVHEGEDIVSPLGTPVYAVVDGTLDRQVVNGAPGTSLSGNGWYLTDPTNKTYYFYAHLSGFKDGLTVGATVKQGDVIGYVGDTGNPGPGNYHLHFEVHPKGGAAVDPLPLLNVPYGCAVY